MRECTLWKSELIHPLTGVSKTPLLEKNHQRTMSTDGEEIFILMGGGVSSEMLLKRWLLSSECGFGGVFDLIVHPFLCWVLPLLCCSHLTLALKSQLCLFPTPGSAASCW